MDEQNPNLPSAGIASQVMVAKPSSEIPTPVVKPNEIKAPDSAAVVGRDALKWMKEVLEATVVLALAGIAIFTFTNQIAYMIATFAITIVLLCAFGWLVYRVYYHKIPGDKIALAFITVLLIPTFCSSLVSMYYWRTITDPAIISNVNTISIIEGIDQKADGTTARAIILHSDCATHAFYDFKGDTVELLLTKKSWVETLRISKIKVFTDNYEVVPKNMCSISCKSNSLDVPFSCQVDIGDKGHSSETDTTFAYGVYSGIVSLSKDKPYIVMNIKCNHHIGGIYTVRVGVEVADNDSHKTYTIFSKPVRLYIYGLLPINDAPLKVPEMPKEPNTAKAKPMPAPEKK